MTIIRYLALADDGGYSRIGEGGVWTPTGGGPRLRNEGNALKKLTAPKHLSAAARTWWQQIVDEYDLAGDTAGVLLLTKAAEAWDRAERCRKRIDEDGEVIVDRFGQPKPHPLLAAERDARSQFLAALKALNLDLEPLEAKPGRPAGR